MNIKAVTFDLWATLLLEENGADARRMKARCNNITKVLNGFGFDVSIQQVSTALAATTPSLLKIWELNRDVTTQEQIKLIVDNILRGMVTLKPELVKELSDAYVSPLFEVPPYLNPDTRELLHWLKEQNMKITIICNTGRTPGSALRRFLEEEDISGYFDLMLFSDEVGIRKPDPQIFLMTAERINVKPCEIIHIGDDLKNDVWGARNAGFMTIHLSTETSRDMVAESDPTSLVSLSKLLGNVRKEEIIADKTIPSLAKAVEAIESIDKSLVERAL